MELLQKAKNILEVVNATDVRIYETNTITPLFDYVINATVKSSRQLNSIVQHTKEKSTELGFNIRGIEGQTGGIWVLIDLYDVLINVFVEEERKRYGLDKLWSNLPQINYDNI